MRPGSLVGLLTVAMACAPGGPTTLRGVDSDGQDTEVPGDSSPTGPGADSDDDTDADTGDSATVSPPTVVDVLFVVDDSCSMTEEQARLATAFSSFLDELQGSTVDWHVAVVSTDMDNRQKQGKLIRASGISVVDATTPDPQTVFTLLVSLGASGSFTERGLQASQRAIEQPTPVLQTANAGFLRPDADLHVVFVSDEDDQSAPGTTRPQWLSVMRSRSQATARPAMAWGLVGPVPLGCAVGSTEAAPAGVYQAAVQELGGQVWSVCDQDFGPHLRALAQVVAGTATP
ncbi:MAG: hypothetical protein H6732_00015 [Alphaproteobacteria bacterium]|nr:hypothetical protein [Alphaproteobacteria bacterium]